MIKIDNFIMNPPYVGCKQVSNSKKGSSGSTRHLSEIIYDKIRECSPSHFIGISPLSKESRYKTAEHIDNAFDGVWNYVWLFDLLGNENEYFSEKSINIRFQHKEEPLVLAGNCGTILFLNDSEKYKTGNLFQCGGNINTPLYLSSDFHLKAPISKLPANKEIAQFIEACNSSKTFLEGRKWSQTSQLSPYFLQKFYDKWKEGTLDFDEETHKSYEEWKKNTKVQRIKTEDLV